MKYLTGLLVIVLALALGMVLGCGQDDKTTADDVKKEASEALNKAGDYVKEQTDQFMKDMQAKSSEWGQKVDELEKKAREKADQMSQEMKAAMDRLEQKRQEYAQKMEELKGKGEQAWKDASEQLKKALEDLQRAYQEAEGELQKT